MSLVIISTNPKQVAFSNPNRKSLTVQMLPDAIATQNTGLVFGKFGSAPVADVDSNTWDFVLSAGASDGTNTFETRDKALIDKDLWLISDTADQQVNVNEI